MTPMTCSKARHRLIDPTNIKCRDRKVENLGIVLVRARHPVFTVSNVVEMIPNTNILTPCLSLLLRQYIMHSCMVFTQLRWL